MHAPPTSGLTTLFTGFSNPFDHIHVLTFEEQLTGMGFSVFGIWTLIESDIDAGSLSSSAFKGGEYWESIKTSHK